MTTTERLYQLIQTLPEAQIDEILNFAEFLHHKLHNPHNPPKVIPLGTLTGLRGIVKYSGSTPLTDDDLVFNAEELFLELDQQGLDHEEVNRG